MNTDTVVFKFGGASVRDAAAVRNVAKILEQHRAPQTVVVISAMGKTTNALEELAAACFRKSDDAPEILRRVRDYHWEIAAELFAENHEVFAQLNDQFVEIEWLLTDPQHTDYDFLYDQIVSVGELLSTRIVAAYLIEMGMPCAWLDVRDVLKTDNTWREARVAWDETRT